MKIFRRIFGNIDSNGKRLTIEKAFNLKMGEGYFNHDVDEGSIEYQNIKPLISQLNLKDDIIGTQFTNNEIKQSDVLVFKGNHISGYPQPENPKEVFSNAYKNSCPACGTHDEQITPFRIKEPRNGKHKMFSLNWINDELFVHRDLYEVIFKKLGLGYKEVILHSKNQILQFLIQLDIPKATFEWNLGNVPSSKCVACGRIKYSPVEIGFYSMPQLSGAHIIKSREFFGSDFAASNKILVSNQLMNELINNKISKIHQFTPTR